MFEFVYPKNKEDRGQYLPVFRSPVVSVSFSFKVARGIGVPTELFLVELTLTPDYDYLTVPESPAPNNCDP